MRSVHPATGRLVQEYAGHSPADAAACLDRAAAAQPAWAALPFAARAAVLTRAAALLRERTGALARLATIEMGKPIAQAEGEVEKCAWVCEWYAEHAERLLAPESVATDATRSGTRCEPLGVLLAIMPWNFPFWQVFRAAAPALMAGNVVALKHASNVPGVALAIESLLREAGAHEGVFATLLVPASGAAALIAHDAVAAVTLTGSEAAGRQVGGTAGAALKKVVLELGGSDPFVVLADADMDEAAAVAVTARVQNNGQSCIAAKRFIVEAPAAEAFTRAFVARTRALVVGDPLNRATQVGPLARPEFVDDLDDQVQRTLAAGATLLAGGHRIEGPGWYYAPTVLGGVTPGMAAFDEETFGPLAPVTIARDAADAVRLANLTRYGLGASLWTRDATKGEALAREIRAGAVFVNGMVKSDPRLPFGGIKASGHGRELAGTGIREFVNLKTVWVREG
ncbi:MAG: NAD-dependent succinate-semialdehyde dehydrogenase [Candidatus Eisenbacteria bacterium]|uniref:NAD-dependent succinate-semialdehyde dehydrogenase n=1 Tax=Eiseniibacteriota bacterium TaxID=2212470 RepID=A0A933SD82_UNCEI|nr:NAD-dependent succinate-semialdehyde dehydrogenase [Candidatus Eisenbacteria bacterium]